MKTTVDAIFQGGVFKPAQRPGFSEGEHVRMTVESVEQTKVADILDLATRVYEGLSPNDIDDIEQMARHRTFFTDAHH